MTSKLIHCKKLNKEAEGLDKPPYPGPMGKRIFEEISKEAWNLWLKEQTILINENQLNLADPASREFLQSRMSEFLFGE